MQMISIIIPVYNAVSSIQQCLQSVMEQTYTNLEVIVVDDCSSDGCMTIVEKMVSEYHGKIVFCIISLKQNVGPSKARTIGIDTAKGEWIYFLDHDDWLLPDCMTCLMARVQQYTDVQIVFAGAKATNNEYEWMDYTLKTLPDYSNDHAWLQESMLRRFDFGMTLWGKLISTDFIRTNNLYPKSIVHEDEEWNFQASKYIQSAAFVHGNIQMYRVTNNSIMNGHSVNEKIARLYELWNVLIQEIDDHNRPLQIYAIYRYIYINTQQEFYRRKKYLSSLLFLRLAVKSHNAFSFRLLLQSVRCLW